MFVRQFSTENAINLVQLKYFCGVIETGSITRTAAKMNVAQTALGIQIRNLEDELGVALLDRHSRGVTSTDAGNLLYDHAKDILSRVDSAQREVRRMSGKGFVSLTLGVTPSIMRLVGDNILVDLEKNVSGVQLGLVEEFSFLQMRLLADGALSCALTYEDVSGTTLSKRALLEEDLMFLSAPDDTPEGDTITFREVLNSQLALTSREDVIFRLIDQMAERLGLKLNASYEVQSIRAVKDLVAKGVAQTVMPFGAAKGELQKGKLKGRLIVAPTVTRTLLFVHRPEFESHLCSASFRAFIDRICDQLIEAEGPTMRRL